MNSLETFWIIGGSLGPILGALGSLGHLFGSSGARLGSILGALGVLWAPFWVFWGSNGWLWGSLGPHWPPKAPKVKFPQFFPSIWGSFFIFGPVPRGKYTLITGRDLLYSIASRIPPGRVSWVVGWFGELLDC